MPSNPQQSPHPSAQPLSTARRGLALFSLVLAGETIFMPVFYLGRYFRATTREVLGIEEVQFGEMYAMYGIVAMASYLIGGPIADRISPRKLIAGSLLATAAGSVYLSTLPDFSSLRILYGFWGASTIVAFWAPMIRATRELGGDQTQGRAFGVLDGGRGLAGALAAMIAVRGVVLWFGAGALEDAELQVDSISSLALFFAGCCLLAASAVWWLVPEFSAATASTVSLAQRQTTTFSRVTSVARSPAIWLQAVIVIAAYCAYKSIDYYGDYCQDAYQLNDEQAARTMAWLTFLRVGAAFGAGWLADRWLGAASMIMVCFATLVLGFAALVVMPAQASLFFVGISVVAVSFAAFFGLRGVYFALFEQCQLPPHLTGTAVGLVSFIGFTPDVFFNVTMSNIVQSARESGDVMSGYQQAFALLAIISLVGLVAAWLLQRRIACPN